MKRLVDGLTLSPSHLVLVLPVALLLAYGALAPVGDACSPNCARSCSRG